MAGRCIRGGRKIICLLFRSLFFFLLSSVRETRTFRSENCSTKYYTNAYYTYDECFYCQRLADFLLRAARGKNAHYIDITYYNTYTRCGRGAHGLFSPFTCALRCKICFKYYLYSLYARVASDVDEISKRCTHISPDGIIIIGRGDLKYAAFDVRCIGIIILYIMRLLRTNVAVRARVVIIVPTI